MKFIKQLNQGDTDIQPPVTKPVPMQVNASALPDDSDQPRRCFRRRPEARGQQTLCPKACAP